MGQTRLLIDNVNTTTVSATFYPQRSTDESGLFQIKWDRVGEFDLYLRGRAGPNAPWYNVEVLTEASADSHTDLAVSGSTIASAVALFPEMYVAAVPDSVGSNPALDKATVSAWLTE